MVVTQQLSVGARSDSGSAAAAARQRQRWHVREQRPRATRAGSDIDPCIIISLYEIRFVSDSKQMRHRVARGHVSCSAERPLEQIRSCVGICPRECNIHYTHQFFLAASVANSRDGVTPNVNNHGPQDGPLHMGESASAPPSSTLISWQAKASSG